MSSYNPPRENVPIFDSSLFVEDTGGTGITQAEADIRYLKFPSAQGIEIFSAGLSSNTLNATADNSTMTVGGNLSSGTIRIGGSLGAGDKMFMGSNANSRVIFDSRLVSNTYDGFATNSNMTYAGNLLSGNVGIATAPTNTTAIAIGSSTSSVALNGATTVLGTSLINSTGGANTTIGSVNAGIATLRGSSIGILGTATLNSTGGLNTTIGTDGTGTTILRGATTTIGGTTIGLTGATTVVGTALINATGGADTTIGTSATGQTTVRGATTAVSGTQINITGATTVIGGSLINSTGGADTTIGTAAQGNSTLRGATTAINGTTVGITSTSTLNLALGATSILNVGVVGRTNANADHHYSDGPSCIAGANVHINNGEKNRSTTRIQDGDGTTITDADGGVNILTGAFNTGTVAIGQYTNNTTNKSITNIKGDVNLATTGGNVVIGEDSANSSIEMPCRSILIGNTTPSNDLNTIEIGVDTGTFRSTTTIDGTVKLNDAGGDTTIGTSDGSSKTTIVGTLKADTIAGTAGNITMTIGKDITTGGTVGLNQNIGLDIGQDLTTGKIRMGQNITTGLITIGNSDMESCNFDSKVVVLGNNRGTGRLETRFTEVGLNLAATVVSPLLSASTTVIRGNTISLGTTAPASGVGTGVITIGNVDSTTTVAGTLKNNKLDSTLAVVPANTILSIGSNMTAGTIKIGENIENNSGNVGIILLGNAATGTAAQQTNIVQVQGRFQSNYLRSKNISDTLAIADDQNASGITTIGSSVSQTTINSNFTLNKPITPAYDYSYTTTSIPNQIGARCDNGGTGGAPVTVTGDGQWRYYLYVNNVPTGIYLFQYWVNLGVGATYSLSETTIYQRALPFTTAGDLIGLTPPTNQNFANLMPNIANSSNLQTSPNFPIFIEIATPNVAFALKTTTNINPATYHGLTLWRIA